MVIDVIILSYAKNDDIIKMNIECIDSINNSSKEHSFNIYVIETESHKQYVYPQNNVKVIQPRIEFNYNKFINIGLLYCKSDWVLISNNDTYYYENFLEEMLIAHNNDNELLSMSAMDDEWISHKSFDKSKDVYYGYRTSFEIAGWCILLNRTVLNKIGTFDENFVFFYQDNDYASTLKKYNIKHGLVTKSKVKHYVSISHDLIDGDKKFDMTHGMLNTYNNKWLV